MHDRPPLQPGALRVGFAYDVLGNGKLSVRAAGMASFSNTPTETRVTPRRSEGTAPNVANPPTNITLVGYDQAGGSGLQFPLSLIAIPTHATWPYVQQFNLAVEGELPSHTVAQVAFVGSLGRHMPIRHEINQLAPLCRSKSLQGRPDDFRR